MKANKKKLGLFLLLATALCVAVYVLKPKGIKTSSGDLRKDIMALMYSEPQAEKDKFYKILYQSNISNQELNDLYIMVLYYYQDKTITDPVLLKRLETLVTKYNIAS